MYIIKIKSGDPLTVSDGSNLKAKWITFMQNPKSRNEVVEIQNWTGTLSDIKGIEIVTEKTESNNTFSEWLGMKKKRMHETPEEKAKHTGFIKLFHKIMADKNLEDEDMELKKKVYERTLKFFKENPTRIYPDLVIFKDLYPGAKVSMVGNAVLSMLGRQIAQDCKYV
jgi:hypothetical protein